MKQLVVLGLWLLASLTALPAQAAWNADWKQRVKITLNTTAADGLPIAAPVESVPLLVRLHTGNFQFVEAKPDGSDLRFIAADDKTPLKFHVEKFDGLNELALVWVQLPRLAPGSKTDFVWLYYGNPNAAPASDSKTSYDAAQALVHHFGERETLPQDATANGNHATASTAKVSAAGLIGGALAFDGEGQITLPATPSLKAGAEGLTVSLWIKPVDVAEATIYSLGDGAGALRLSVRGGRLVAQLGTLTATAATPLAAATWQHVSVVVKDGLALYLNGQESGRVAGSAAAPGAGGTLGRGFKGEVDELQIATTARSADWIKTAALSQGQDQKLVSYGAAEGEAAAEDGQSYLKILLSAVTLDGWIVIGILAVMFVVSIWVMISKALYVSRVARDNQRFMSQFNELIEGVSAADNVAEQEARDRAATSRYPHSQLSRLYAVGIAELRGRFAAYRKAGRKMEISEPSLEAIRATVDARMVRELQRLNSKMVLLTISIAGGPFLGLLGTVVGVMITFAAIAAAGDVNVNAIAPGIAAALVATVAGLAVAIPALFGYNYLTGRIGELTSDMQVFVDELTTRIAENHSA
jgi:biopolymer transport protein ExbB